MDLHLMTYRNMANLLQTVGKDIPEIHIVGLRGTQRDKTLRKALALRGCPKHGGKGGWMLVSSVSERVLGMADFPTVKSVETRAKTRSHG